MTTYSTAQPVSGPPTCCGAAMQVAADAATCERCGSQLSGQTGERTPPARAKLVGTLAAIRDRVLVLTPYTAAKLCRGDVLALSYLPELRPDMPFRTGRLTVAEVDAVRGEVTCDQPIASAIPTALASAAETCDCPDRVYRMIAETSLRAGVDQRFAELRAKAIAAASISGTAPAPDFDAGVPVPWCSRERCVFWDGARCYPLRAAPNLGVCEPVFNEMYPPPAPVIVNAPADARVEGCERSCCAPAAPSKETP